MARPEIAEAGPENRWHRHPVLAAGLRGLIVGVPLMASLATSLLVAHFLPAPTGLAGHLSWFVAVSVPTTAMLFLTERLARRLLPLAMLLRLTLLFPDQAPSRFGIALRTGSLHRLRTWATEEADRDHGVSAAEQAESVLSLAAALNTHDRRTRGHSERVRALTDLMAEELALSPDETDKLRWGALLHDLGKLTVPPEILNKAGKPTPAEWSTLQGHPAAGARLASPLQDWLGAWSHAIDQHHERYDGKGYPNHLSGAEISLAGRIVSVTDAFETMTAQRAYKSPMSVTDARAELQRCAGSHFDPTVVRAFLAISLGKLRRTMGLAAFAAQVPILGLAARAGAHVQVLAQNASVEVVLAGAAAVALGATIVSPAPVASASAAVASETSRASATSATGSPTTNAASVTADQIAIVADGSGATLARDAAPPPPSSAASPASGGAAPSTSSGGSAGGGPAGGGSPAAGPPSTTAPPAAAVRSYSSAGGGVTVKLENGALSIVTTEPAPGYAEERHDTGPDRVEIRFDDGNTEWRIRVEVSDGEPTAEITQH